VVLDVSMPRLDGLQACRDLRAEGVWLPVLMLTARDSVGDRVAGIDAGADDYLVKPFALQELLARVRALLRRSMLVVPAERPVGATDDEPPEDELSFADLRLNPQTREVRRGARPLRLTRTEFSILEVFLQHPRQVLTRAILFDRVWGYDFGESSNSLHVYLGYLRRKLEAEGEPRLLHTVRGVGFVLREEPL
jgi:two-component system response regulator MprA